MKIKILHIRGIFALIISITSLQITAQTRLADSTALVNFYNATNGASWTNKTNWASASPINTWFGVTLTAGRVTEVSLPNNNVAGPESLVNSLTALIKLNLSNNQISGALPYYNNNIIQELNLSNNLITGGINYFQVAALKILNLSRNSLTGSIAASNYAVIENLDLSFNQFSGSLPYYNRATTKSINLSNNALTGTINYYGTANLEVFNLSNNQLSGSIASASSYANLKTLDLSYNAFTGAPPYFGSSNIQSINLSHNSLSGNLPFFSTAALLNLNLSYNSLTGNMNYNTHPLIQSLDVSNNQLAGTVNFGTNALQTLKLENNLYSFKQMQGIGTMVVTNLTYAPQNFKPTLTYESGKIKAAGAGGTLANNTYKWYLAGGVLQGTTVGDSTFTPAQAGNYYVDVTNSVATALTLQSNNFNIATLPITLVSFKVNLVGNSSKLEWSTSSEQNFDHYSIERSTDGILWNSIGDIKSKSLNGNSNSQLNYSFYDDVKSLKGTIYYKLKQVDKDGTFEYSTIVPLKLNQLENQAAGISVYPNPSKGGEEVTVEMSGSDSNAQVKVIDMLGRELKTVNSIKNTTQVKLNLNGIPAGFYKVIWINGSQKAEQTTLIIN